MGGSAVWRLEPDAARGSTRALCRLRDGSARHRRGRRRQSALGRLRPRAGVGRRNRADPLQRRALATVDYGTALGVRRAAHEAGRGVHVMSTRRGPSCKARTDGVGVAQGVGVPSDGHHRQHGGELSCSGGNVDWYRRHRSDGGQRRRREQNRHLSIGDGTASRGTVLCRGAIVVDRSGLSERRGNSN